jgi:hypothetical protein
MSDVVAVAGLVIAVAGVFATILVYYLARKAEADIRRIEAAKPFLDLQQSRYTEALTIAAILANPETHDDVELTNAKRQFRELYVAELSMVELRHQWWNQRWCASRPELTRNCLR